MEPFDADVIIAGAGPAGTVAAFDLASKGASVLILEKAVFPRYKVCGAGLTHKVLDLVPYDLTPVIETTIHSVRFSYEFGEIYSRTSENPLMYCAMRDRLDAYMLEKATDAGAKVVFEEQVTGVSQDAGGVQVVTRNHRYRTRLLIGADGASGMVSRMADLRRDIEMGLAWEAEIPAGHALVKSLKETVCLDWGTFPGGYAWMFPKNDHLSIGVGGPARLSEKMIPYYLNFVKTIPGLQFETENPKAFLRAWPIPVCRKKGPFHNGRVLVAGDAAGLTDPMTGEGIWYAVKSGRMAASACRRYLGNETESLSGYSASVNDDLMEELLEAYRIRNIFNAAPRKIHQLVRDNERVWRAFGKILRGERHYADVKHGFGKWQFFWHAATRVAGLIYLWKERHFK